MIKQVNIQTTIKDYKERSDNEGKVALYDLEKKTVIYEGDELDWYELQEKLEEANTDREVYHMIIVPHIGKLIRGFSWK